MNRDDFSPKIKEIISRRSAYICSNPKCRRLTLGPSENDQEKFQLTGIAAYITAAAPKGPRYDENLTEEQLDFIIESLKTKNNDKEREN